MTESPAIHPEIAALFNRPRRKLTRLVPTMQQYCDFVRVFDNVYRNVQRTPQFAKSKPAAIAEKTAQIVDEGLVPA